MFYSLFNSNFVCSYAYIDWFLFNGYLFLLLSLNTHLNPIHQLLLYPSHFSGRKCLDCSHFKVIDFSQHDLVVIDLLYLKEYQ